MLESALESAQGHGNVVGMVLESYVSVFITTSCSPLIFNDLDIFILYQCMSLGTTFMFAVNSTVRQMVRDECYHPPYEHFDAPLYLCSIGN